MAGGLIRLVSRQPPAALNRYLVTMRPLESTRRRPRHAVLPSTAGKLHVEMRSNVETRRAGIVRGRRSAVVVRAIWAIVGGLRSQKTKEESQPPVRAKVGVTWVQCRSENQLL